ncbi:unnamed protein product [Rotaria sp. Silwood2]|nr:unnamed protein product [Rotaria sp. Silwood2]
MRLTMANVNTHSNIDILPQSETASYTSMNSSTPSSVTTSRSDGSGSTNFHIDFNESILQVHKRSPLYIIGDRAQRCVSLYRCNTINTWDYITKVNRESVRYYNFLYSPSNDNYVLRSAYKMCSFDIWNFYLNDTFEMGCPCNLDIALAKHYEYLNNAESRQRSVYAHHGLSHPFLSSSVAGNNSGPQHRTHEDYLRKRGHILKQ